MQGNETKSWWTFLEEQEVTFQGRTYQVRVALGPFKDTWMYAIFVYCEERDEWISWLHYRLHHGEPTLTYPQDRYVSDRVSWHGVGYRASGLGPFYEGDSVELFYDTVPTGHLIFGVWKAENGRLTKIG